MNFELLLLSFLSFVLCEINIHIIPHTHLDVGWIQTIEEYRSTVDEIFNAVFVNLKSNPSRTFVFCEMEYFQKWYESKEAEDKALIKKWLSEKRIEFVGGGTTMNDESNAYYENILSNYRFGFSFLKSEFGIQPETGWFLDSFGHTAGNAHISSKLGYKQIVMGRLDKDDLENRIKKQTLEFNWKPFNNDEIFTHLLPFHYGSTQTFANFFHSKINKVNANTVINWINLAIPQIRKVMKGLKHNNYLFLIGDDFTYSSYDFIFNNIEAFMEGLNKNGYKEEKVNMFYSTPSKYFNAVLQGTSKSTFETQYDIDFVPYSCKGNTFWSGYYTSRPYLKGKIKEMANMYLISSKVIAELLLSAVKVKTKEVNRLLKVIGIMQHHDTITGTSKERVNDNYIKITKPILGLVNNHTLEAIYQNYININIKKLCLSNPIVNFGCKNEFSLINSNNDEMIIGIINPLIEGKLLISMEFLSSLFSYEVYDQNNVLIPSDFYCVQDQLFKYNNTCFMNFFYLFSKDIDLTSFKLKNSHKEVKQLSVFPNEKITLNILSSKVSSLSFDPNTLNYSLTLIDGITTEYNFKLAFTYYEGYNSFKKCDFGYTNYDGAYIFAPCTKEHQPCSTSLLNSYTYQGNLGFVTMIRFDVGYIISTLFYDPCFMKVESILDPIERNMGINIALVLASDINNSINLPDDDDISTEFWTDSNGLKMFRRITNYRDTFKYNKTQTIAGNFYPIVESISIREKKSRGFFNDKYTGLSINDRMISIFTDRVQSGGGLKEGEVILLINRASTNDDAKGLGEPLYETKSMQNYFKVQHLIMFGTSIYSRPENGIKSQQFMFNFFRNTPILFNSLQSRYFQSYSMLSQIFSISNNIVINYYFLIKKTIEFQFYCKYDYYYQTSVKNDDLISYFGLISVNLKEYDVEIKGEYIGNNDYFKSQNMARMKGSKKFYIEVGANDIFFLQMKFSN